MTARSHTRIRNNERRRAWARAAKHRATSAKRSRRRQAKPREDA